MGIGVVEFVERSDVRPRMDAAFPNPGRGVNSLLVAPALSGQPQLVGTAFHYYCIVRLCHNYNEPSPFDPYYGSIETESIEETLRSAFEIIEQFINCGEDSQELFHSLLTVVQYHRFRELCRQHYVEWKFRGNDDPPGWPSDERIGQHSQAEIDDLDQLAALLPESNFLHGSSDVKHWPAFDWREDILSGYGDLLIDRVLLDIKTTVEPNWKSGYWRQLFAYYLLNDIHNELKQADFYNSYNEPKSAHSIDKLGIYFARYGTVKTVPVELIINQQQKYENFRAWFTEKAIEVNGDKHRNYDDLRDILCNQYTYQQQTSLADF